MNANIEEAFEKVKGVKKLVLGLEIAWSRRSERF